jgi:hypothetical protein
MAATDAYPIPAPPSSTVVPLLSQRTSAFAILPALQAWASTGQVYPI